MLWLLLGFYVINISAVLIVGLRDVQRPLATLTWIFVCLFFPVIGLVSYWMLSRPLRARPREQSAVKFGDHGPIVPNSEASITNETFKKAGVGAQGKRSALPVRFPESVLQIAGWITTTTNVSPVTAQVNIMETGIEKYRSLLDALYRARRQIDIEYYIYRDDEIGRAVTKALINRAAAGVKIRFLRDGLGSRKLPPSVLQELYNAGIEVRTFHPFHFPWLTPTLNHRDHCKIVTIDETISFTGGINIGDEYTGQSPKTGPWRDTHLELSGSECVQQLQQIFDNNWAISAPFTVHSATASQVRADDEDPAQHLPVDVHQDVRRQAHADPKQRTGQQIDGMRRELLQEATAEAAHELAVFPKSPGRPYTAYVQALNSGPDSHNEPVRDLFFLAATEARDSLDITTPYFVPDTDIVTALKTAAARGVTIRLLVPAQPDHVVIGWASMTFYEDLIKAGIQVYLYEQGILHAKVLVMDGELSVVGAANYDLRSFLENYEVCEVLYGRDISQHLTSQMEQDLAGSRKLTPAELNAQTRGVKIRNKAARLIAPLL